MDSLVVFVLAALCAAPSAAFFQDILQPIQELKQSLLPHPQPAPQPYPQYYHQYRRAAYDGPAQQGYVSSRPVVYQYVQSRPVQSAQPVQQHYDVGTGYSYGGASSNPFAAFWQQGVQGVQGIASNAWLPWSANRQPLQPVQAVAQPLSAQPVQLQQQQQQPLQAIWSILPWTASHSAQQQPASGNPVLSFFQNSASLLPWSQQSSSRPGLIYTTPLAPSYSSSSSSSSSSPSSPSSLSSGPSTHVVSASIAPVQSLQAASLFPEQATVVHESSGTPDVKPEGLVLDDSTLAVQHLADNGIRRIALSHQHEAGVPCAS